MREEYAIAKENAALSDEVVNEIISEIEKTTMLPLKRRQLVDNFIFAVLAQFLILCCLICVVLYLE